MSEWQKMSLAQVVGLKRGFDLPESRRTHGPYPVLGSSGISGWHNEAPVKGPGVTIGRSGASIGAATYFNGPYWPLNTTLFAEAFKGNHPRFIFYLLRSINFRSFNSGSAQPSLNRNYIANIKVNIPKPAEQWAIAETLGVLDDKITVNNRVADSCHRLAELHYRDLTRSSAGVPLSSVADPILGGTPDRAVPAYWGCGNLWASAKDVAASQYGTLVTTEDEITDLAVAETKAKPVGSGSVILTARGTVGAVARVAQPTSLNQSCYAFTPDQIPPAVLYLMVRAAVRQMIGVAHGTVFSTVNMNTFEHIQVPALTTSEINVLESFATPLLDVVEQRVRENESLTELRDTLLPRLMSGELRVREAERVVEDAT
jgi:type I restriction enzyme, S subunit